jgi:hypothetical protein
MIFRKKQIKMSLAQVREELDEHLGSINDNTDEIQSNYAYVQKLGDKIDRLVSRLDRIEMLIEGQQKSHTVQPLTYAEKQIFLVLYTEEVPLTYADIVQRTGFSDALVKHHLNCLIEKGVPVIKSYFNATPFMKIHPGFKEKQAKENVINLSLKSFVPD